MGRGLGTGHILIGLVGIVAWVGEARGQEVVAPDDAAPAEAPEEPEEPDDDDELPSPPVTENFPVAPSLPNVIPGAMSWQPDPAEAVPPAGWRFILSDLTIFRLNPLGLETRVRIGLQKRLYYSEEALEKNNFVFLGAFPRLNPASVHAGLGAEIQPLSILNVRAFANVQQYFGTFGFLQTFASPTANYSDSTLKDLRDDPLRPPQTGRLYQLSVQPLIQLKLGPIAVRALFQFDRWAIAGVRAGSTTAYEPTVDTLLPDRGWTVSTDADVLYTGRKGLAIGVRHSYVRPFYKQRHFAATGEDNQAAFEAYTDANTHQRMGLFAAYTFKDLGPSRFNKPTVILIASWYLSHRYRAGEPDAPQAADVGPDNYVSRAMPYLILGFAFESDFLNLLRR